MLASAAVTPPRAGLVRALSALAITALYVGSASPVILGGDNGEFATLFAEAGVAHPSGYPLFTLILRAFSWMPGSTPAEGAARVTALLGALSAWVWYRAGRWWGAGEGASLLAASLYATASLPWRLATHAEVFTLNALLAGAIVAASGPDSRWRGARRGVALGALAGLALANHLSCVLLAPIGLDALLRARDEDRKSLRPFAIALLSALPGLATYLLLMRWARDPGERLVWGSPTTLSALAHHVLRGDYGTTRLSSSGVAADPLAQLGWLARSLADNTALAGVALAPLGLYAARGDRRRPWIALTLTLLLAGPLFITRFNITPTGVGAAVVERFHLLPLALLAPFIARGITALSAHIPARAPVKSLASMGLVAALALRSWPAVRDAHGPEVERYLRDTLSGVAPRAVILCTGDQRTLGYPYLQRAQGLRRDVLVIDPWSLLVSGTPERLSARLGAAIPAPIDRHVNTRALAAAALSTGRPVYLSDPFSQAILRTFPSHPEGAMIRLVPRGEPLPSLDALVADSLSRYARYRVPPAPPSMGAWQRDARESYLTSLRALASAARRAGRPELVSALAPYAQRIAPWQGL